MSRDSIAAEGPAPVAVLSTAPDEADLVPRARHGDRWAQEALYRRHAPAVWRTAVRLLRREADAEDVVQDAFIAAFKKLDTLATPAHFGRWVTRIAVHRAYNVLRRRRLRRLLGLERNAAEQAKLEQAYVDAPQEARLELLALDAALSRLAAAERTCWVLRHLEQRRLDEIVELTGFSLATVKRKLAKADRSIRRRTGVDDD